MGAVILRMQMLLLSAMKRSPEASTARSGELYMVPPVAAISALAADPPSLK